MRSGSRCPAFYGEIPPMRWGILNDDGGYFYCITYRNYLAYGLAASALWVLGIPHGFALMHGKTRRGALVFDVADLVKDTLVLPFAFIAASGGLSGQEFREMCLNKLVEHKALDYMYEKVKAQSRKIYAFENQ